MYISQSKLKTWNVFSWSYYGLGCLDQNSIVRGRTHNVVCRLGMSTSLNNNLSDNFNRFTNRLLFSSRPAFISEALLSFDLVPSIYTVKLQNHTFTFWSFHGSFQRDSFADENSQIKTLRKEIQILFWVQSLISVLWFYSITIDLLIKRVKVQLKTIKPFTTGYKTIIHHLSKALTTEYECTTSIQI